MEISIIILFVIGLFFFTANGKKICLLIYYIFKDIIHNIKNRKNNKYNFSNFYGIHLFCGRTGGGKNMTVNYLICGIREKYKDNVYIATNFNHKMADFKFISLEEINKDYDKPILFVIDESNTIFNSRKYKEFDFDFLRTLTHNRHKRKMIYCLTQDYNMLDISFRRLCLYVYQCKTRFHRLTIFKKYLVEDYEQLINEKNVDKKRKIKPLQRLSFVQTDELRNMYDTLEMVEDLKKVLSKEEN